MSTSDTEITSPLSTTEAISLSARPAPSATQDTLHNEWMDSARDALLTTPATRTHKIRKILNTSLNPVIQVPRKLTHWFQTSPGKIMLMALLLIVTILAAGMSMAYSASNQKERINYLQSFTEPFADASEDIFTGLNSADVSANTVFIQQSYGRSPEHQQYNDSIELVSSAIVRASADHPDTSSDTMPLILTIQNQLPTYTALVSQANTLNNQNDLQGGAYLIQAGDLMHNELLPAAEHLYRESRENVAQEQSKISQPRWLPLTGLAAAVLFLVLAQLWLASHTNRIINRGFLAATVIMLLAFLWSAAATLIAWHTGNTEAERVSQPLNTLTDTRINTQKMRSLEVFTLITQDTSEKSIRSFTATVKEADTSLSDVRKVISAKNTVDTARENLREWDSAHGAATTALKKGQSGQGISITTDSSYTPSSKATFDAFDQDMSTLIQELRTQLQSYFSDGQTMAIRVSVIIGIMTVAAGLCVALGVRNRIREYL